MKNIKKIASEIISKMLTLDPTRQQSRIILQELRKEFGIEVVRDPIWRKYITYREEPSNKYHYFVVFQNDANDKYVAANAYGRIGYRPKVVNLGEYDTKIDALQTAQKKLNTKLQKGYEETKLD